MLCLCLGLLPLVHHRALGELDLLKEEGTHDALLDALTADGSAVGARHTALTLGGVLEVVVGHVLDAGKSLLAARLAARHTLGMFGHVLGHIATARCTNRLHTVSSSPVCMSAGSSYAVISGHDANLSNSHKHKLRNFKSRARSALGQSLIICATRTNFGHQQSH